jgi:septal ring factor EnvC (AmiA/AmiB activator)
VRSLKWILIGFFFIAWMIHFGPDYLWAAPTDLIEKDLNQKKKDLKDIKKELTLTKEREKKIQGKETSILESLHTMETEIYHKERELKQVEARLARTKERLQQTKNQIATLNRGTERTKEELFSRLIALYKMERIPPETFLLTSQSYFDLLRIDKFLRIIIDFDAHLINTYRYQVTMKSRYQEELIRDQVQWERHISEVEKKKKEIEQVRKKKQALLKSIQNQKVVYKKVIGELEERAKDLQTLINKLEREKTLLAYGTSKYKILKGKLTPPVNGKVISLFKEKGQNGIEIRAPMGAEIQTILPGKVLYADWFKGFGNVVVIDHGDHMFTIYGYASELLKKEEDIVSKGETIALVGNSGSLKGPCLYFEIRHQGKPQDPMQWISPLDKGVFLSEGNNKAKK